MPSLAELVPEIAAYRQSHQVAQQQGMGNLQQMGALQGILQKMQAAKQEQAFRGALQALGPNPSQESLAQLAAQFSPAKDILTSQTASADRKAALESANANRDASREQTRALQTERLEQQVELAKQRSEDQSLSRAEQNQARMDMVRLAASLRPPPVTQPLQAYTDPTTGKAKLGTREEAHGNAPAVKETANRVIPANIAKAYTENSTALRKIDLALAEVDKYPSAFGLQNMRGDAISQRMDPKGVTARAIIADIGSLKIHDRSGAAVTAAETPRLLPFIPSVNDKPETIRKKLALFRKEYASIQNDIGSMYSADQGYRALPSAQTRLTDGVLTPDEAAELSALKEKHGR